MTATHRHKAYQCPACKSTLSASTSVYTDQPRPPAQGDLTICDQCMCVLSFVQLGFRRLSRDELAELPEATRADIETSKMMIRAAREQRK